jgi:hypothetical protein
VQYLINALSLNQFEERKNNLISKQLLKKTKKGAEIKLVCSNLVTNIVNNYNKTTTSNIFNKKIIIKIIFITFKKYIYIYIVCIPEMERDRPGEESESAVENELAGGECSPE